MMRALLLCAVLAHGGEVRFGADARFELAGTLQLLSGVRPPRFKTPDDARTIERRFKSYREHPAVRAHAALQAWDFVDRFGLLTPLSPPPALGEEREIRHSFFQAAGGEAKADAWLGGLRAFARDADFSRLAAGRLKELAASATRIEASTRRDDILPRLERYAGVVFHGRYDVLVTPFVAAGAAFNQVDWTAEGARIVTVYGDGEPPVRELTCNSRDLAPTMWHELGHGIFDPYAEMFGPEIAAREPEGFRPEHCYGSWKQCVKEHVVRAVVVRLLAEARGRGAAAAQLDCFALEEFTRIREMTALLPAYEQDRKRRPSLAHYYRELLQVFPRTREYADAAWFNDAPFAFPARARAARAVVVLADLAAYADDQQRRRLTARRAALLYHLGDFPRAAAAARAVLADGPYPLAARVAQLAEGCAPSASCALNAAPAFMYKDSLLMGPRKTRP